MTAYQFCDLIKRSGLMSETLLNETTARFTLIAPMGLRADASLFAEFCIEAGELTRWQATMLLAKKFKGFIIGNYRVIDRCERPDLYRAQHRTKQDVVDILTVPKSPYFIVMKPGSLIDVTTERGD